MISINQIIAFCLVAVLIAFIAVLARMAGPAIELLKKTKTLVSTGTEAVEDTKSKIAEIKDKITETLDSIIHDTSPAIKVIGVVGLVLTGYNILKSLFGAVVAGGGLFGLLSAASERKKAAKEIKLSKKTIKKINKQAKLERKAFAKAEVQARKLQRRDACNAKKAARIEERNAMKAAAAAAALSARVAKTEKKAAAKAAKAQKAIALKTAKAEKKANAIAAKAERAMMIKTLKAQKSAASLASRLERRGIRIDAKNLKKALKRAEKRAGKSVDETLKPIKADINRAKLKWRLAKTGAAVGSALLKVQGKAAKAAIKGAGNLVKKRFAKLAEKRAAAKAAASDEAWEL